MRRLDNEVVSAFLNAASAPLEAHRSGSLDEAERIRAEHPDVVSANIYTAAVVADEGHVRSFLELDAGLATQTGGPRDWDALTCLCFSRYLRLDRSRSDAFVRVARLLLEAGADANTGWVEMIDHPNPRPMQEAVIYGAAGVAQHPELTRLLLEYGADPNDGETPYHAPETRDNTTVQVLLDSGKLNANSLATLLLRKCDWHDEAGVRLLLAHGADPNHMTIWGYTALHQAIRRDNGLDTVEALVAHGADPLLPSRDGWSAVRIAAHRGRSDVLRLCQQRGIDIHLEGIDGLIAACALDESDEIQELLTLHPEWQERLVAEGGALLAVFAGVGNRAGVRRLLQLGVWVDSLYRHGDGYFEIAPGSTALHVAAWRAQHDVVEELIAHGASVNARDGRGRSALQLAVKACVDSYWMGRRSPESVRALLAAGADASDITLPTGYAEIDVLLGEP